MFTLRQRWIFDILKKRHNEIRDVFADLMNEVFYDVKIEPHLKPLEDEVINTNLLALMTKHNGYQRQWLMGNSAQ